MAKTKIKIQRVTPRQLRHGVRNLDPIAVKNVTQEYFTGEGDTELEAIADLAAKTGLNMKDFQCL